VIFLDTHVAIWIAGTEIQRLSAKAAAAIRASDSVVVSPVVVLEIQYLVEAGRLRQDTHAATSVLATAGIGIHDVSLAEVVSKATEVVWTRDPFDRLIVGHAKTQEAALVTKDQTVLDHYPRSLW
jgi:PIN domain nuclease of toxin-antitoxin system